MRERDDVLVHGRALADAGNLVGAADLVDAEARVDRARCLPFLRELLDALAFDDRGLRWRYVPAGTFVMGDDIGDVDEAPAHAVTLTGFYMADAPIAPADFGFAELRDVGGVVRLHLADVYRINRRPEMDAPLEARRPLVAVNLDEADQIARQFRGRLPTEAEFERAARGCFVGAQYPWGDAQPSDALADCRALERAGFLARKVEERLAEPSRAFPPNDYGIYGLAGGVWQWCADAYDAAFYAVAPAFAPRCADVVVPTAVNTRADVRQVIRGGSYVDDVDALRVACRGAMSRNRVSPVVGVRVVRDVTAARP